jgi:hypothetical protein
LVRPTGAAAARNVALNAHVGRLDPSGQAARRCPNTEVRSNRHPLPQRLPIQLNVLVDHVFHERHGANVRLLQVYSDVTLLERFDIEPYSDFSSK